MLSNSDKLKSRVLMAKAQIPIYRILGAFIEKFPEWDGKEAEVKRYFNLYQSNEKFTKQLEQWAKDYQQDEK